MERPKYKIMDALLLAQQGHAPASEPENYVSGPEEEEGAKIVADMKKREKAEPDKVYKSDDKINISGNVPSRPQEQPEVAPEMQPEVAPQPERRESLMDAVKLDLEPEEEYQEAEEQALETGTKQVHESAKSLTDEYPNFWVGAAPVLMGALLGDLGAGAAAGSEGLLQRYKDERDAAQADIKARRAAASKSDTMKPVFDPKLGYSVYKPQSSVEGQRVGSSGQDLDIYGQKKKIAGDQSVANYKAKGQNFIKSKGEFGREVLVDRTNPNGRPIPLYGAEVKSDWQRNKIGKVADKIEKADDPLKYNSLLGGLEDLRSGDQLGAKAALKVYAKSLEPGGRLSDFDVEFLQYLFGTQKYEGMLEEFKTGKLNQTMEQQLTKRMVKGIQRYERSMKKHYERAYRSLVRQAGIKKDEAIKIIGLPPTTKSVNVKVDGEIAPVPLDVFYEMIEEDKDGTIRIESYE